MKIFNIETGNFKADGGAMFGVVPKALWSKKYPVDENNLCRISDRALLVDTGKRKVLIDTGIGNKQDEKWLAFHCLHGDHSLEKSLNNAGYQFHEVTDVIFTHLHWDHCGGGVVKNSDNSFSLQFPNARYWISKEQWEWATNPNKRELPAYPPENILPLKGNKQVWFVEEEGEIIPGIEVRFFYGHTKGLMLPVIHNQGQSVFFAGDLIPVMANMPSVYVAAYDVEPLKTIEEKDAMLEEGVEKDWIVIFQHDINNQACTLQKTKKGVRPKDVLKVEDL